MRNRKSSRNGLLPNSLRIISSCLKTVSSNAGSVASTVRSAGASVAASIAAPTEDEKNQVLWAGFDKLELSLSSFKNVLLLGYSNGFQVLDVEDATDVRVLVSKHDGPVTFLQMQPIPVTSEGPEGFRSSHPMLLVVAGDETNGSGVLQGGRLSALIRDGCNESMQGNCVSVPTVVRFFSLRFNNIVHVLRFRSAVYVVRCSPRIVAVALAAQIYCFDAVTLENKFSVLTYPIPGVDVNVGCGPMALGSRWLAYASNNPLPVNTGHLSPRNLTPSPGVSPSTSPGNGSLIARYAMESSKQLAAGIINLGDMGYKTLSKYYQDLLPDGSTSPISNSGRKIGKLAHSTHSGEADNAGMVVIKDFVSKDVISQFRAHTSPISALCFDPSGTLLVTASIHGNNINVFRIMPTSISNGSNSIHYDWTSSHVHLYKLYRGLTTAVIKDISFSNYSQWISIVSSRGTCHIYVLSPFGGDAGLRTQNLHGDGPIFVPNLSIPWWSKSSCVTSHQNFPPPPPMTLSVVSRIKSGNCGWLDTVSTVTASASGKLHVQYGAVATTFHNSIHNNFQEIHSKVLEQLLVHSPSGHVIQYELTPSSHGESVEGNSRTGSSPLLQIQDEDFRVNAEPLKWWDVCRRLDWPDRDGCMPIVVSGVKQDAEIAADASDCEKNKTKYTESSRRSVKAPERQSWYLSNAEIRGSNGQLPIWQKSKICFYLVNPSNDVWRAFDDSSGGEFEIEKMPVLEVEIREKDLLPIFQHFHGVQSDRHDRNLDGVQNPSASSVKADKSGAKLIEDVITQNPNASKNCADFGEEVDDCRGISIPAISQTNPDARIASEISVQDNYCSTGSDSTGSGFSSLNKYVSHSHNGTSSDVSTSSDSSTNSLQTPELPHFLQEGYCKLSDLDDCHDLAEAATDADSSSSYCEREKREEDGDNDDMLGGVFAFSE